MILKYGWPLNLTMTIYRFSRILQIVLSLNEWALLRNKIHFNPSKFQVLSIPGKKSNVGFIPVPFIRFQYLLSQAPLEETNSEKDVTAIVTENLCFENQLSKLLSKANQQFRITKRTCSFVKRYQTTQIFILGSH